MVLAADGPEGLRLFAEHDPDIVLLDMLLPGCTGSTSAGGSGRPRRFPILMVSAVDTELDVVLGLELGASGYVTKPFRLRELVARMHAILRRVAPRPLRPSEVSTADAAIDPAPTGTTPVPVSGPAFGAVSVDYVRREVTVDGAADPPVPQGVRPAGRAALPGPAGAVPGRADRPAVARHAT